MKYRRLPHGGEEISIVGMGGASLSGSVDDMCAVIEAAIAGGVNYFDLAPAESAPFEAFARIVPKYRDRIYLQMHFGAVYADGKYGWSRKLDEIKAQWEWNLQKLGTDYTDIGFLHCVDDHDDATEVLENGIWDYMQEQKRLGRIRHLGFSSHNPDVACRILDTGLIDVMMFSINPAYDYRHGEYAMGEVAERAELYRRCEAMGVGITVMKPLAGGQLLDAKTSLFRRALTPAQCYCYALDRPAVLTVLPGIGTLDELKAALDFVDAPAETTDYSIIGEFTPQDASGICVYCNHCQPCPAGLNVGLINKYYDLALADDPLAVEHYRNLPLHADDCTHCGHCDSRCPFKVKQSAHMNEIAAWFAK